MKKTAQFHLVDAIKDYFSITPYMPIMEWIDTYISYADDVSAERDKPDFSQYPYQVEPIKQWEDLNMRKHVTVVMCEQMGKTNMFLLGLLWRMVYDPCQSLVVYPSDSKSAEMNETKIRPLMSHIPGLKEELLRPRAVRSDRYNFSGLKSWFQGAGSKIVSKSCKIVIADEVDQWPTEHPQNLRDLEKRTRSYNESMTFIVCSPTTQQGQIWQNFLKGSQRILHTPLQRLWKIDNEKL